MCVDQLPPHLKQGRNYEEGRTRGGPLKVAKVSRGV